MLNINPMLKAIRITAYQMQLWSAQLDGTILILSFA